MIVRLLARAALSALVLVLPLAAFAGVDGYWKTIDDETGNVRSIVHITVKDGVARGQIVQLFRQPGEVPDPTCTACSGELNGQRTNGLFIMNNLQQNGQYWQDGTILDPKNGRTYGCYIEEVEENKKLKVRGYLGLSVLGRTQYWYRAEPPDKTIRSYLLNSKGEAMPYVFADGKQASEDEVKAHLAK